MSVAMLLKPKMFHARAFGNRSVITKAYMVASGTLVCKACASENVACMKPVICCSVITSAKNPPVEGSQVVAMAIHEPDFDDIFEKDRLDTHYPKRPASLEEVCLYDFVANYDWAK